MNQEEIEKLLHQEGLKLASISKRATAFFLDELLLSLVIIVAIWDSFSSVTNSIEAIEVTQQFTLEFAILRILYQAIFVTKYGATLGKMALKIRVVSLPLLDNPPPLVALNRAVFRIISEMIFYLGFIWAMMNPTRQSWHDLTARTLVIES